MKNKHNDDSYKSDILVSPVLLALLFMILVALLLFLIQNWTVL